MFDSKAFFSGVLGFFGAFLLFGAASVIYAQIYNTGYLAGYECGAKAATINNPGKYYKCGE